MTTIPMGKFIWHELLTTDTEGAETFYRAVTKWGLQPNDMNDIPYTIFTTSDFGVAGMMLLPEAAKAQGARPCWMGYVGVPDTDACVAKAMELGGKTYVPPTDIPNIGRFAVIGDPHGAGLCVMAPSMTPAQNRPSMNTPGMIPWNELMAGSMEEDFAFYAALFGWTKGEAIDMGPMGTYQLYGQGEDILGGMMTKPPTLPVPFWQFYINVEDINAAKARVEAAGGKVINGPHQVPGNAWILQGLDPQGVLFALVAPPTPGEASASCGPA